MDTCSLFLPEKLHGQRAWQATVHGVTKSQTWLSTHVSIIMHLFYMYYISTSLHIYIYIYWINGFSDGSVEKNLPATARDMGLIPGWGWSPGEGSGNPLQFSCLGNSMNRGASYGATKESDMV